MTDLLNTLRARGFVQDATPDLADRLRAGPLTAYVGFDPTADSLHVGSLVPVMGARLAPALRAHADRAGGRGHRDGGRSERQVATSVRSSAWTRSTGTSQGIARQLARVLSVRGAATRARMRNNADWLRGIRLMDFLRDTGKHFTLGYMLQKESVRSRLERGISYTEFSYMLIQAYDFWHLHRTERCELQMGGERPVGQHHGRHRADQPPRRASRCMDWSFRSSPTRRASKFGKSEGGNIWLDPARTSPYHFYQFWVNTDDEDVERYLKLFTFLPLERIAAVMAEHAQRARSAARRSASWRARSR